MNQINLIIVNGNYYRMESKKDELFDDVCDVKGHLFFDDKDILPEEPKDSLFKFCFICDQHIQFWQYSSDMVDAMKSKVMCC